MVSTFGNTSLPGARDVASGITREKCIALLRSAIGVPDLAVEIVDVAAWKAVAHTADRYGMGRVFRAGDAAHVMLPAGGFGGNTGVHDAHNLAWKLAAVLRGHAAPALLDSYESERRPVGVLTVGQAYTRWVRRVDPDLGVAGAPPVVEDMTMEIGYLYDAGGLYADPRQYPVPVGARAPHLTLLQDGLSLSSLDLLGHSFVLLVGSEGVAWDEAANRAAPDIQAPFEVHRLSIDGLADMERRFTTVFGKDEAGAVLIRPDGFICWRSGDEVPSAETIRHQIALALQMAN